MFNYISAPRGKLSNTPYNITRDHIKLMLEVNEQDKIECEKVTQSSYRNESYYANDGKLGNEKIKDTFLALAKEVLYRDMKTAGFIMEYPHGIIIRQAERNHFYRGENKIHLKSVSSIYRKPNEISITENIEEKEELALYQLIADMRVAEFNNFIHYFDLVKQWENAGFTVLYEALAQHYGIKTRWLDITNDFKVALFFACCYWDDTQKQWFPLTKAQTEKSEDTKYGVIFHIPKHGADLLSLQCLDSVVGNDGIYGIKNSHAIWPIGFQPFRRCDMQTGYGIFMNEPFPLQDDIQFEKLYFRHDEKLSKWIYEEMEQGKKVYPNEGLEDFFDIIDAIIKTNVFSEEAFLFGMQHSKYFHDELNVKEYLAKVRLFDAPIKIESSNIFNLSRQRLRKINHKTKNLDFEKYLGIKLRMRLACYPKEK